MRKTIHYKRIRKMFNDSSTLLNCCIEKSCLLLPPARVFFFSVTVGSTIITSSWIAKPPVWLHLSACNICVLNALCRVELDLTMMTQCDLLYLTVRNLGYTECTYFPNSLYKSIARIANTNFQIFSPLYGPSNRPSPHYLPHIFESPFV